MSLKLEETRTKDQREAIAILKELEMPTVVKLLLEFFIENICAVGCAEEEGCFYCRENRLALHAFIPSWKRASDRGLNS